MIITPLLVIFMVLVFILVFLFVRTIDKRKWLTFLVSLVLTPLVYFYMFYPFLNIISPFHHQKYFDAAAWEDKPGLRYEMIGDIIDSDILIGKSKTEVENLLGTYEWLSWNDATKSHDNDKWNYGLGLLPGAFNDEKECITVEFEDGKAIGLQQFKEQIVFEADE